MIRLSDKAFFLLRNLRDEPAICSNRYAPASELICQGLATGKPTQWPGDREIVITAAGAAYASEASPAYPGNDSIEVTKDLQVPFVSSEVS